MTKEQLKTLLQSPDIHFRRMAIDETVMSFPEHADLFFQAFHTDGEQARQMADAARQWMPALRDGFGDATDPIDCNLDHSSFGNLADDLNVFVCEMHRDLQSLDEDSARHTAERLWYHFPGIRTELKEFGQPRTVEENRQLMVFVTGRCNLSCPYCFSKELHRSSISRTDMARILAWAKRQGVKSLLPCGGEPLMYENMDWLIGETALLGMKMYFATNLTVPLPRAMQQQNAPAVGQLHVHLTDELFRNKELMAVFRNNMDTCRRNGLSIVLRGNIGSDGEAYRGDEWLGLAKEYGIDSLNVAFTIPSHSGSNRFVHLETLEPITPHLRHLWEQGRKNNIRVSVAKPLPLCLLPEDLALDILRHNHTAAFCNVGEDGGMHNLSLSNDMHFSPCLGVDEPRVPFDDKLEWESLRQLFGPTVDALQDKPLFPQCSNCFLHRRKLCQGACLSYKQTSRNATSPCID